MTTASDDERLLAAVADARRRFGDGVLTDPSRLTLLLNDAAPDLRARIPALVAALELRAPEQLRGAQDPGLAGRLLAAIASRTGSDEARAALGLNLALRVDETGTAAGAAPAAPPLPDARDADWIGVSQPASGAGADPVPAARPSPSEALPPALRNKWVLAGIAAVAAIFVVRASGIVEVREDPPPRGQPAPGQPAPGPQGDPGGAPPGGNTTAPMLTKDGKHLPTVPVQGGQKGTQLVFTVPIPSGQLAGALWFPGSQSWDRAQVAFARPGTAPGTISSEAGFKLVKDGGDAIRGMTPQWTRDELSAGPVCVTFSQHNASDVQFRGSLLCLWDNSDHKCGQPIGCGIVG